MTGSQAKISRIALVLACFIGLTQLAWAQKPAEAPTHGISGYLDPQTGAFRPMAQTPAVTTDTEALAALAPTGGTLVFNITITFKSALGTDTIGCSANADVFDSGLDYHEDAGVTVTAGAVGTTKTCKITIPYSWPLATAATDTAALGVNVTDLSFIALKLPVPTRSHSRSLPPIKIPLGGATTTLTVAVTL